MDGRANGQRAVLLNLLGFFPSRHACQGHTSHPPVTTRVPDRTHKPARKVNTGSTGQTPCKKRKGQGSLLRLPGSLPREASGPWWEG